MKRSHQTSWLARGPSGVGIRRSSDPQVPFVTTTARIDSRHVLPPAITTSRFPLKVGIATTNLGCLGLGPVSTGLSSARHAAARSSGRSSGNCSSNLVRRRRPEVRSEEAGVFENWRPRTLRGGLLWQWWWQVVRHVAV